MSLAVSIAKNTFFQVVGKIIGTIFGLITIALMTRYLGQTGFGYYTSIITYLQFFGVVIDFGLQMTASQLLGRPNADESKIFSNILAMRLISAVIFMGIAVSFVWLLPYPDIIKLGVTITSLSFVMIAVQSVYISLFQKNLNMYVVALGDVFGRGVLLLGIWFFIYASKGLMYIMVAVVLGSLANFIYLIVKSNKYLKFKLSFDFKVWKDIYKMSWPLAITISLSLIYFRADTLVMSFVRPQNEVGLYGAAYKIIDVLVQFPYLFLGLLLPIFAKFIILDKAIFKVILQKTFDFMSIITIPMMVAVIVLGNKIMALIAGNEFAVSGDLLKILILAVGTIFFGSFFGYAVVAAGLQKKMIKFYIINAIISLILYLIFIPMYSYWAAAILTVFSELLITIPAYYVLKKNMNIKFDIKVLNKSILASLFMGIVLMLLISFNLFVLIIVGVIVYFAALYAMRGIDKGMVKEIIKYKNN